MFSCDFCENFKKTYFIDHRCICSIFLVLSVVLTRSIKIASQSFRCSLQELFLRKGAQKICSKFTGGPPCQSVISIKLQSNFMEITLWHDCSPVNLLHIFQDNFSEEHLWRMLLKLEQLHDRYFTFKDFLRMFLKKIFFVVILSRAPMNGCFWVSG